MSENLRGAPSLTGLASERTEQADVAALESLADSFSKSAAEQHRLLVSATSTHDRATYAATRISLERIAANLRRAIDELRAARRAKALSELAELDADEIERMSTTLLGAEGQL